MSLRLPRPPRPPSGAGRIPGAPAPQRGLKLTAQAMQPYPDPPYWWAPHPLTEWIVFDYLRRVKHWIVYGSPDPNGPPSPQGADAWYQAVIPAPGLYQTKGFFRGDFLIIPSGRGGSPGPPYGRGIVLDPVSTWTHRESGQDRLRREILAQAAFLLVWLDDTALQTRPRDIIEKALRGQDESSIALGRR